MNIDKSKLRMGIWYEDADGNRFEDNDHVDAPEKAVTAHVCFPLEIQEEIYMLHNYDGIRTYHGSDHICTMSCHIGGGNEKAILAMANSGDFTLSEALAWWASACERCTNAMIWEYTNGEDGYPEYGEEWQKCNTVCEWCKTETAGEDDL